MNPTWTFNAPYWSLTISGASSRERYVQGWVRGRFEEDGTVGFYYSLPDQLEEDIPPPKATLDEAKAHLLVKALIRFEELRNTPEDKDEFDTEEVI